MKKIIVSILCFYQLTLLAQQKPMFTNFIFNEFYYNPAVAASKEHIDFRALYRNQWAGLKGAPQTMNLTGYGRLKKFPLGLGGNIFHDVTGPLRTTGFSVAAAYGIEFNNEGMLCGGISAGIIRYDLGNNFTI